MPPPRLNHRPAANRRLFKELDRDRRIRHTRSAIQHLEYWWSRVTPEERLQFLRDIRIDPRS
jgi:hypothetical protein